MNKNGFTLVELIAVILILGLLTTFATISVLQIAQKVNQKRYSTLIQEIQIASENYSLDLNRKLFFVQDLIDEGYIEADKDGNIYNPLDHSLLLNCHPIEVETSNGELITKIHDESYVKDGDICDNTRLASSEYNLDIKKEKIDASLYNVTISAPLNSNLIIVSNHGMYKKVTNTDKSTYTYQIVINTSSSYTITAIIKVPESNSIKSKSIILN